MEHFRPLTLLLCTENWNFWKRNSKNEKHWVTMAWRHWFNFQGIRSVNNASPMQDLLSVSLAFLICWSNQSFLVGFLPPDGFQNGPVIPHHLCLCVPLSALVYECVLLRVGQRPGGRLHIKTVTGRSHFVFNFTRVSSHLWGPISFRRASWVMPVLPGRVMTSDRTYVINANAVMKCISTPHLYFLHLYVTHRTTLKNICKHFAREVHSWPMEICIYCI